MLLVAAAAPTVGRWAAIGVTESSVGGEWCRAREILKLDQRLDADLNAFGGLRLELGCVDHPFDRLR